MGRMFAKDSKQSGGGAILAAIILLAVVLLPALYVASLGPAVWLIERGYIPEDSPTPGVIYWPLQALANRSQTVHDGLMWHVELFR
jgi:hypothetical protein